MNDVTFRITRVGPHRVVGTVHCVTETDLPQNAPLAQALPIAQERVRCQLAEALWGEQEILLRQIVWALRTWPHWALSIDHQIQATKLVDEIEQVLSFFQTKRQPIKEMSCSLIPT